MSKYHKAIRSREDCANAMWDWGFLKGDFPRNILPMDIDGMVEIEGRFLAIEAKPIGPGGKMPYGQRLAYERLAKKEDFTVVVIYGDPLSYDIQYMKVLGKHKKRVACDIEYFREFCRQWGEWATDNPSAVE